VLCDDHSKIQLSNVVLILNDTFIGGKASLLFVMQDVYCGDREVALPSTQWKEEKRLVQCVPIIASQRLHQRTCHGSFSAMALRPSTLKHEEDANKKT
jgi:hypothetical protein